MSEDDDEDPFENLGPAEDREGDPFDRLDEGAADERPAIPADDHDDDENSEPTESDASTEPREYEEEFIERDEDPAPGGADDDPFSGMDDRDGDPFDGAEGAFEAVDVGTINEEEVWASLAEDATPTPSQSERYTEVSKHRFCEQCEFFSEPPNAHCTHDEAEIVEYLDMETVRLLNCPIVAEQRAIERDE